MPTSMLALSARRETNFSGDDGRGGIVVAIEALE